MTIANVWLPSNLNEFYDKVKQYCSTGDIDFDHVYPDFPTGGVIINKDELKEIYETGKGRCVLRAKATIKDRSILITELPYQVYAEPLIESIKQLVNNEELVGIKDIYNKSDKTRLLIEIECEKDPANVLNRLYNLTELQKIFNANQYAMITKVPELLTLKQYIEAYVNHNKTCILREYKYDLAKAQARLEIVDGLLKALESIDNIIATIKQSKNASDAHANLIKQYDFTDNQAKAILEMKLSKLAHLEGVELNNEQKELKNNIAHLTEVINSDDLIQKEFLTRLDSFVSKYGWTRRTEITQLDYVMESNDKDPEAKYVEPEQCVVIMTETGMIKRVSSSIFKIQKRNTSGIKNKDALIKSVIKTNTADNLLVFSSKGKLYKLSVNKIPNGTNSSSGVYIKTLIEMESDETPEVIYSLYKGTDNASIFFATKNGIIKKLALADCATVRKKAGTQVIKLKNNDTLASAIIIDKEPVLLLSANGKCIQIDSTTISPSGRASSGVKGMTLGVDDRIICALAIRNVNDKLAIFSKEGLGKRISLDTLSTQNRGGKGLIIYKPNPASGEVVAGTLVEDNDIVFISGSSSICIEAKDIPEGSRVAMGSKILKNGIISSVSKVWQ